MSTADLLLPASPPPPSLPSRECVNFCVHAFLVCSCFVVYMNAMEHNMLLQYVIMLLQQGNMYLAEDRILCFELMVRGISILHELIRCK
jgi:cellulose synthase/poly-beta-1,6-N-acetylglucosamine synthase-like glycosyltransferase